MGGNKDNKHHCVRNGAIKLVGLKTCLCLLTNIILKVIIPLKHKH